MLNINNQEIINFYEQHPYLNIEEVNLLFINFITSILNKTSTNEINNNSIINLLNTINSKCNNLQTSITQVQSFQDKLDTTILDAIKLQIYNIKDVYINELEKYIQNGNNIQLKEIQNMSDKYNNNLLINIKNQLGDVYFTKINEQLTIFNRDIQSEFKNIITTSSQSDVINKFEANFNNKYDILHKYLYEMNNDIIKHVDKIDCKDDFNLIKTYFDRQKHSSNKGIDGENKLELILNKLFPSDDVQNTTGKGKSGDFIVYRDNLSNIMFENKDYINNIPPCEIDKFIRDIENMNIDGIFLSQNSGISRKQDFQIDIYNNNIIIYVHHVNYNIDKIKIAINMLNHLKSKLNTIDNSSATNIDESTLFEINKEYRFFLQQRTALLELVKKFNKDITKQINDIELPQLHSLLANKYASSDIIPFTCTYCNSTYKNAKALAAHVKKCKIKQSTTNES